MKNWRRPRPCGCMGYWFPHRKGGGACDYSKTRDYHLARRAGDDDLDARITQALFGPKRVATHCPF